MRLFTLLFLYLTPFLLASQYANFIGKIIDSSTQSPIAYANIGVVGKNIGTVSDYQGNFKLTVADKFARDTIRISIIGYKPINISVLKLQEQLNQANVIELEEQITKVPEIVVVDRGLNPKVIGNRNSIRNLSLGFASDTLGNEMAIRCKVRKKQSYLKNLSVYINNNPYDTLRFRVNIYDIKKGKPSTVINRQPIYTEITIKKGSHVLDLTPYNIITSEDFFVSFEWIEDLTESAKTSGNIGLQIPFEWLRNFRRFDYFEHSGLNFAASLLRKSVYHRSTSHGAWKKISGLGIRMNVEVLQ